MASKPFLKWAGGKHKLVPFIEHNLPTPARKRLIEPFCGSAALSLALDFEHYLLNDINADLIGLFRIRFIPYPKRRKIRIHRLYPLFLYFRKQ